MIKKNIISIIGLGYVGLPLALEFSKKFEVIGFDINKKRIHEIKKGFDTNGDIDLSLINSKNKIIFTSDDKFLLTSNIYIITVPTPIYKNYKPNLSIVYSAIKLISRFLTKNNFIIFESTVFPGATEELFIPLIERESNLKLNIDFFCGYSPERINPGDKNKKLTDIIKITSGSNNYSASFIDSLYKKIIKVGTCKVDNIKIAESAKVIENAQRDLNIAFVNELSIIFNKLGINTKKVLDAASTKWNFLNFKPGLVGGHCIGVDPYYLAYRSKQAGYNPKIILSGRNVNNFMPKFIFKEFIKNMKNKNIKVQNSKVLIMGITFKENCSDIRNSKSIEIYDLLLKKNINIQVFDPLANISELENNFNINTISFPKINYYDSILILVPHSKIKKLGKKKILSFTKKKSIIYDIKNTFFDKSFFSL